VADQVSAIWRTKPLEYTWLRSLMKKYADFRQATQDSLDFALDVFNITEPQLRNDFIDAWLHLKCYPDVPDTLAKLKDSGR